jgi:hypothetical protein
MRTNEWIRFIECDTNGRFRIKECNRYTKEVNWYGPYRWRWLTTFILRLKDFDDF